MPILYHLTQAITFLRRGQGLPALERFLKSSVREMSNIDIITGRILTLRLQVKCLLYRERTGSMKFFSDSKQQVASHTHVPNAHVVIHKTNN